MFLVLGVIDVPYAGDTQAPTKVGKAKKGKANKPLNKSKDVVEFVTTGEVATKLESRYHVMQHFVNAHQTRMQQMLVESLQNQIVNMNLGAPVQEGQLLMEGLEEIQHRFRDFLDRAEIEHMGVAGVPTKAALDGINHRFKDPFTGKRRPSFIDTGTYQAHFKAWIE